MLNCDCYTIATEVPVWMDEFDLTAKERKERKKLDDSNCRAGTGNALPAETQDHNAAGRPSTVPLAITPAKLKNPLGDRVPPNGSLGEFALPNNSKPETGNSKLIAGHIDLLQYKFNTLYILVGLERATPFQPRFTTNGGKVYDHSRPTTDFHLYNSFPPCTRFPIARSRFETYLSCMSTELPDRKHLKRIPVWIPSNQRVIYFVTVCCADREKFLKALSGYLAEPDSSGPIGIPNNTPPFACTECRANPFQAVDNARAAGGLFVIRDSSFVGLERLKTFQPHPAQRREGLRPFAPYNRFTTNGGTRPTGERLLYSEATTAGSGYVA